MIRVTTKMMSDNATNRMAGNLERLYELQNNIASEKKFTKPSENASGASRALSLRSIRQANDAYGKLAESADLWISTNEASLQELTDIGSRSITLSNGALSDTNGPNERNAVKGEIKELIQTVVNLGNTTYNDQYIFNGYDVKSSTLPYEYDQSRLDDILYEPITPADTNQDIQIKYGEGQYITMNFSGQNTITPLLNGLVEAYRALNAPTYDSTALTTAVVNLNKAMETVKTSLTTNGVRSREITNAIDYLKRTDTEIRGLISQNEDVDLATAISDLRQQETTYKAALEVTTKALSTSNLFEYI